MHHRSMVALKKEAAKKCIKSEGKRLIRSDTEISSSPPSSKSGFLSFGMLVVACTFLSVSRPRKLSMRK